MRREVDALGLVGAVSEGKSAPHRPFGHLLPARRGEEKKNPSPDPVHAPDRGPERPIAVKVEQHPSPDRGPKRKTSLAPPAGRGTALRCDAG